MIYGYARVSTAGQSINGNSLEDQTKALKDYGCQEIVTEAFSGKTMERPQFTRLFHRLQLGDTLVVCKLDRFARTAIEGVSTVRELFERGVRVHILNMGMIENTLTGNLILTVMLAFAEYERGMIVERTQTGKAIARQSPNFREGRPKKFIPSQIDHALELLQSGKTYRQVEAMTGISKSTLVRAKNKHHHSIEKGAHKLRAPLSYLRFLIRSIIPPKEAIIMAISKRMVSPVKGFSVQRENFTTNSESFSISGTIYSPLERFCIILWPSQSIEITS